MRHICSRDMGGANTCDLGPGLSRQALLLQVHPKPQHKQSSPCPGPHTQQSPRRHVRCGHSPAGKTGRTEPPAARARAGRGHTGKTGRPRQQQQRMCRLARSGPRPAEWLGEPRSHGPAAGCLNLRTCTSVCGTARHGMGPPRPTNTLTGHAVCARATADSARTVLLACLLYTLWKPRCVC